MDGEYKPVFHPSTNTFASDSNDDVNSNGSGSGDADDGITSYQRYADSQLQHIYPSDASQDEEFEAVHAKCLAISSATGCLVSAVQQDVDVSGNGKNGLGRNERSGGRDDVEGDAKGNGKPWGWEFQLSGGYAQVMDARRRIPAEFRPDVSVLFRTPPILRSRLFALPLRFVVFVLCSLPTIPCSLYLHVLSSRSRHLPS